jgi:hypothetical protein
VTTPNINANQIAINPATGSLYYVDENSNIVETSLDWIKETAQITTSEDVLLSNDLTISGNLTVNGNTVVVNTETITVEDNIIILNTGIASNVANTLNAGIEVERGSSTNVQIRWNESSDRWEFTNDGTTFNPIGVANANTTGTSAGWTTARTITLGGDLEGSVSIDGTSNVTLTANVIANAVTLGTDTTGSYVETISVGTGLSRTGSTGEAANPTIALNASINDLNDVTIGSAANGDFLRWTGTEWINDAVNLSSDTTGSYVQSIAAGTGVTVNVGESEAATPTISIGQDVATSANVTFNTVNANVTANTANIATLHVNGIEIDPTGALNTQVLKYDLANNIFVPGVASTVAALDDLTDVTISSAAAGQVLKYNGSAWVNQPDAEAAGISFSQTIGDGSSTTYTITHNLNTRDTVVVCRNVNSPYEVIEVRWEATTLNTTTIDFSGPIGTDSVKIMIFAAVSGTGYTPPSSLTSIDDILDVNVATPNSGDFLKYNGSAWVNDPINLGTDTVGNYMLDVSAGTGITISHTQAEGSTATINANTSYLATRSYVESLSSGINWHATVVAATTGNLAGTYDNGTNGDGATLTKATNGSIGTIDSQSVTAGKRILLKAQNDAKENGIYTIVTTGNSTTPWQIMRAEDADNSSIPATIVPGDAVFVTGGSTNANQGFIQTTYGTGSNNAIVIGTDNITYNQFTGTAAITAGNGLTITTNTLDVVTADSGRIVVNADSIDLASGIVSTGTYKSVTVDTYGRVTAGTNPTTLSGYGITDGISTTLSTGKILVGNASNLAEAVDVSGDVMIASNGNVQISSNTVVNADINSAAAIDYSKLNLSNNISTSDLAAGAARAGFTSTLNEVLANYALVLTDLAKLVTMSNSSTSSITIPANASVAFNVGDRIDVLQKGSGSLQILGASGVTVNCTPQGTANTANLRTQWSSATLVKLATNQWVVIGDLKA